MEHRAFKFSFVSFMAAALSLIAPQTRADVLDISIVSSYSFAPTSLLVAATNDGNGEYTITSIISGTISYTYSGQTWTDTNLKLLNPGSSTLGGIANDNIVYTSNAPYPPGITNLRAGIGMQDSVTGDLLKLETANPGGAQNFDYGWVLQPGGLRLGDIVVDSATVVAAPGPAPGAGVLSFVLLGFAGVLTRARNFRGRWR